MFRRLSIAALLTLVVAAAFSPGPAVAFQAPVPGVVLPPGYQVTEFYRYRTPPGTPVNACCPHGLEFGMGGGFGDDLFFVDAGNRWPGAGIWRVSDRNGDGDGMDPGEGVQVHLSVFSGPPPLGLTAAHDIGNGFDNDMFFTDDQRNQVWRLSDNGGALGLSVFSTGYWTPTAAMFAPHGDKLLVLEASNFTVYGGGADGKIYALSDTAGRTVWADNSQTPRGLWDIQGVAMSNDGWLVTVNAGIVRGVYARELLAFRDNNNDGDARDDGEVKLMADAAAVGQGFHGTFDKDNVYWAAWGDRIMRFEDLNGDGDWWNAGAGDFDPGEFTTWAYNFPGFLTGIEFAADGTMFLGMSDNESPGSSFQGVILRVGSSTPPPPTNRPPTADAGIAAIYECAGPSGAHVTLNGTLSEDPDGDPLTFSWMEGATLLGEGEMLDVDLPVGEHTITLTVMDPLGETDSAEVVITVEDTTPPTISGVPAPIEVDVAGPGGTPSSAVDFSGVSATDLCDGDLAVANDAPATFPVGTTTVTFTATDAAGNTATASTTVTVVDSTPPTISGLPTGPIVLELAGPGGTPSSAVDFSGITASDLGDGTVAVTNDAPALFPPGTTPVTFTAVDSSGNVATASVDVTVIDSVAPTITSATSDVSIIATPNHKMIPVNLTVLGSDASGVVVSRIVAVTSNEAINGQGDGNTDPDWFITGPLTVELRAERSGQGNGRIYTITVECVDAAGNASYADVTVTVPKSQGKKK